MELLLNELSGDVGNLVCTRPLVAAICYVCHNSGVRRFLPPWKWLLASTEGCSLVASLLTLLSLTSLGLIRENRYSSEIVWLEKLDSFQATFIRWVLWEGQL